MQRGLQARCALHGWVALTMGLSACVAAVPPDAQPAPPLPEAAAVRQADPHRTRILPTQLTLFAKTDYRGRAVPIDHAIPNLAATGADPHVRSAAMQAGRWQLCTRPHFSGHCVVTGAPVRDLARIGLRGPLGSLRGSP